MATKFESSMSQAAFWIVASICSSVGIIVVIKYLTTEYSFKFMITLTALHFAVQYVSLNIMALLGVFKRKSMPIGARLSMSAALVASVALMNKNLQTNSLGFYQISKLACIPTIVLIQMFVYKQTFTRYVVVQPLLTCPSSAASSTRWCRVQSPCRRLHTHTVQPRIARQRNSKVLLTLVAVLAGVSLTMSSDASTTPFGVCIAVGAVASTSIAQIWSGTFQ
jgi:hypothetical protein